ncbi:MAG: hypothetical protein IIA64_03905 [Planctomycetes bacterium]|nr:hypothetical protein [Planctomycetota bacterium]
MPSEFNPYQEWLGIADSAHPPNHYQLLGLADFEADPERIWTSVHDRRTVLQPQQHGTHAELANRLQAEVDMAETCLLNPSRKEQYDAELRTRQTSRVPFESSPQGASSSKSADTESPTAAEDPPAAPPSSFG